jgi:membrane-associated phospholipid phosphatase
VGAQRKGKLLQSRVVAGLVLTLGLFPLTALSQGDGQGPSPATPSKPRCTDLSGRVEVPCPNAKQVSPEANPNHAVDYKSPIENSRVTDADAAAVSQQSSNTQPSVASKGQVSTFASGILDGQREFWTIPLRLRLDDANWGVPFGLVTGGLIAADNSIQKELPTSSSTIQRSHTVANYGAVAFAGLTAGSYLWGRYTHNTYLRDTGFMAGEAAANSFLVSEGLKFTMGRQRPTEGSGLGEFFSGGQSFPSEHASAAWSIATVFANRYQGFLPKVLSYGAASAISVSRITGRNHFSSDVFVGSALGWYFGRQSLRRHQQDASANFGVFEKSFEESARAESRRRDPAHMGSPYVPLDSWIYPAFDRLAALGFAPTAFAGLRPWTRLECARLLQEMDSSLGSADSGSVARAIYDALALEFEPDIRLREGGSNRYARVDSVYNRVMGISGKTLNDAYHFGQTIINDYGRPDREGLNFVSGVSASASADMFSVYFRGEYQHSPSALPYSQDVRSMIGTIDHNPVPPAFAPPAVNQFRMPEAYVAMNLGNWQISFGKESFWWGPGKGGPMLFSNNAESFPVLHFDRTTPFLLPSVLRYMGPVRTEYIVGQLQGHEIVFKSGSGFTGHYGETLDIQPFIHGTKISFKPTPNLELGFGYTVLFSGQGVPFTFTTFKNSMIGLGNGNPGSPQDPGDRRSAFDFSYRLPGIRNGATFYADGFTDDQSSPIGFPDRSAWRAGLYFPRIPKLSRLDLRAEGVYTDLPIGGAVSHGFFYANTRFREGYTSETNVSPGQANLIGSWIGRQGQGAQAWSTYWLSAKNSIQVGFRHQKTSAQFIQGGGTLTDASAQAHFWIGSQISLTGLVQYEKWNYPILASTPQSNMTTAVEVTFWPKQAIRSK